MSLFLTALLQLIHQPAADLQVNTLSTPWNPVIANSSHVDSGLFRSVLDLCTSSWESISYPISCLVGFPQHQSKFSPHSSGPHIPCGMTVFLMDHWVFHSVLSLLTDFSSKSYTGNAPLPQPLLSPLWVHRMRSCNPSHCAGAASAQYYRGREGNGLEELEISAWSEPASHGLSKREFLNYTVIQTPMVGRGMFLGVEGWHAELVVIKSNQKDFFFVCFENVTKTFLKYRSKPTAFPAGLNCISYFSSIPVGLTVEGRLCCVL